MHYHYVENKEFLSRMRSICGKIMQSLCHILKENYDIGANFVLVGSGAKNLILQYDSQPIDLDYNLEIIRCNNINDYTIKECVRKSFNKVLKSVGWGDCKDSTSTLTTEKRYLINGNDTAFYMDVCIVKKDNSGNYYRLIHAKTGYRYLDSYFWNQAPQFSALQKKVNYIKSNGKWNLVREQYLKIKNKYPVKDYNHPSFICYTEAINNVYNSINNRGTI